MINKTLLIRADANTEIGTGHVMRCLSLAHAWKARGGAVIFVSVYPVEDLVQSTFPVWHILPEPGTMDDAQDTIAVAIGKKADYIVIDGYRFGSDYQKVIKDAGLSLLVIDDFGAQDHHYANIVVNQNIYADAIPYRHYEPYTRFLLGPKYAMLRDEFTKKIMYDRGIKETGTNILVTFGGGDPKNITLKIIEILKKIDDVSVLVIVGSANPNCHEIEHSVVEDPRFVIRRNVKAMAEYMQWADMTISAGGTVYLELVAMRCPSLIIPIADNQILVAETAKSKKLAKVLSVSDLEDQQAVTTIISDFLKSRRIRSELSKRMECLVDGNGASRVVNAVIADSLKLRRAEISDCRTVYNWINEPSRSLWAIEGDPIPLDQHSAWFSQAITNSHIIYYVAVIDDTPVGQARFNLDALGGAATISINIGKAFRGLSIGSTLVRKATQKFFDETLASTVHAYVKPENTVSMKVFTSADYNDKGMTMEHKNILLHHFMKKKERKI